MTTTSEHIQQACNHQAAGQIYADTGDLTRGMLLLQSASISAQLAIATAIADVQAPPAVSVTDDARTDLAAVLRKSFHNWGQGSHRGRYEHMAQCALEHLIRQSRSTTTEGEHL